MKLLTTFVSVIVFNFFAFELVSGDVLVHEKFSDDNILDDQPATWELRCFNFEACDPNHPTVDYSVKNGELSARFNGFAMWRLLTVGGQDIEPSNNWSIRARIEPQRITEGANRIGGAGVGTDEYYWTDHDPIWRGEVTPIGTGHFGNTRQENNGVALPHFNEYVIQLDVFPDGIEGQMWLVDDPATISKSWWYAEERGEDEVTPGLPVFWGNDGGLAVYREVLVATEPMGTGGDFNLDERLDATDLDLLSSAIQANTNDPRFNLTSDFDVNTDDLDVWVHKLKQTWFGDANLDREFNTSDLVQVFQAGHYENDIAMNSGWAEGDWNGDGEFDTGDLVFAFQDGGYERGPRIAVAAVPEPTNRPLAMGCIMILFCNIRRWRSRFTG